jgi:hypothetical protein
VPSASCGNVSGYSLASQGGGEAVIVARQALTSAFFKLTMTWSNQPKSNSPGRGSISAHEKIPTLTRDTLARRIKSMSSAQTSAGHCSGL